MFDDLDTIPWARLTHAYGSADDVPALLRALPDAPPGERGEDSPLYCLFGNIWHQGTVYEATAPAVPFLMEIARDSATLDRAGVLQLLAEIARSSLPSHRRDADAVAAMTAAHDAVAREFDVLANIAREADPTIRLAAAHVLAHVAARAADAAEVLRTLLIGESDPCARAGLLFLLGLTGDESPATRDCLRTGLSSDNPAERHAAAVARARAASRPLPPDAAQAVIEALVADDYWSTLEGMPWDVEAELDAGMDDLIKCLDAGGRERAAEHWIEMIETGHGSDTVVSNLLRLLFPTSYDQPARQLTSADLSAVQLRAARALAKAVRGPRRIFCGHFPTWGLPDSLRAWDDLAAGRITPPIDMTRPILALAQDPSRTASATRLRPGERVVSRNFGEGTVTRVQRTSSFVNVTVDFDDEGTRTLGLPTD